MFGDDKLVSFFSNIVAGDSDKRADKPVTFDHIFRFIVFWAECRPQFLFDTQLGVNPQEFGVLSAFLIRRRQDIVTYRDSDYPSMKTIANYMLYMYDLLKADVDGRKVFDVAKAKEYTQSFMRVVLVSCHNNGYENQEARIKEIIARIDSEEDWDEEGVWRIKKTLKQLNPRAVTSTLLIFRRFSFMPVLCCSLRRKAIRERLLFPQH